MEMLFWCLKIGHYCHFSNIFQFISHTHPTTWNYILYTIYLRKLFLQKLTIIQVAQNRLLWDVLMLEFWMINCAECYVYVFCWMFRHVWGQQPCLQCQVICILSKASHVEQDCNSLLADFSGGCLMSALASLYMSKFYMTLLHTVVSLKIENYCQHFLPRICILWYWMWI
jgi:hypothetical protein